MDFAPYNYYWDTNYNGDGIYPKALSHHQPCTTTNTAWGVRRQEWAQQYAQMTNNNIHIDPNANLLYIDTSQQGHPLIRSNTNTFSQTTPSLLWANLSTGCPMGEFYKGIASIDPYFRINLNSRSKPLRFIWLMKLIRQAYIHAQYTSSDFYLQQNPIFDDAFFAPKVYWWIMDQNDCPYFPYYRDGSLVIHSNFNNDYVHGDSGFDPNNPDHNVYDKDVFHISPADIETIRGPHIRKSAYIFNILLNVMDCNLAFLHTSHEMILSLKSLILWYQNSLDNIILGTAKDDFLGNTLEAGEAFFPSDYIHSHYAGLFPAYTRPLRATDYCSAMPNAFLAGVGRNKNLIDTAHVSQLNGPSFGNSLNDPNWQNYSLEWRFKDACQRH